MGSETFVAQYDNRPFFAKSLHTTVQISGYTHFLLVILYPIFHLFYFILCLGAFFIDIINPRLSQSFLIFAFILVNPLIHLYLKFLNFFYFILYLGLLLLKCIVILNQVFLHLSFYSLLVFLHLQYIIIPLSRFLYFLPRVSYFIF